MPSGINSRVLIVDDESDLTEALAIRLSSGWGFTVAVAHDGEEGLRKASVFKPDVILLDIAMPVVDGWEVCRRLRDDPNTRDVPVVVMRPGPPTTCSASRPTKGWPRSCSSPPTTTSFSWS